MNGVSGYLIVALGAALGGAMRHGVNVGALKFLGSTFPYGTLAVNVVGSFAMGLLAGWFAHKTDPGEAWGLFLTTGILGGFTTFSSFSLDAALLWQRGPLSHAGFYVLASVVFSLMGLAAGVALIRAMS
jgi:CrcB protein